MSPPLRTVARALALALGIALLPASARAVPTAAEIFDALGFSKEDQDLALRGELVTTDRTDSSDRELTVVMAFVVKVPPDELVEEFYRQADYGADPAVTAFGRIEADAGAEAFQGVRLQPGGRQVAESYLDPQPDEFNLSSEEAAAFRGLVGADPTQAVEEQLRKVLLARYEGYRARGLSGIPPYDRDGKSYQPSDDIRRAVKAQKLMVKYAPSFERTLLEYPKYKADGLREQFLWVNFELDELPTIVLSQRLSAPVGEGIHALSERHYYVSRSHNTVQTFAGIFPVQEGTLVFYENRTSTDRAAGFGSGARHTLGRKIMARQIGGIFDKYRATKAGGAR